ncbi:MAG: hypothetical protein ACFFDI_18095 [Promethearchaeota archaeon]
MSSLGRSTPLLEHVYVPVSVVNERGSLIASASGSSLKDTNLLDREVIYRGKVSISLLVKLVK